MSENLADLVIREVTTDIWTFSRPFARFGFLPWGGRSTAIKLSTGDVWVLASTPLTKDTKETIDKLGPVKWIMAADAVHHLFLSEFKKAYPDAKVIGVEALVEKKKKEGLVLDGAYGSDPTDTLYGFEDEVKACYFSGYANRDVAWLHVTSKTLVQADLLFNLPGNEQYSKVNKFPKVPLIGKLDPYGGLHKKLVWGQGTDKEAMRRDAKTVSAWDFERIIPCHGDVIEKEAKKAWDEAYSKYLT
ncbi:hypothetical protein HGRIS_001968 [Hohenbuehelia grisea]|uniref:Uncharacterized protein n=1 Tax=Hohenbuehelia grisea TaxID=104357 RepID=A0ABR3JK26_9AGAR